MDTGRATDTADTTATADTSDTGPTGRTFGTSDLLAWNDGTRLIPSVDVYLSSGSMLADGVNWDPSQWVGNGGNVMSGVGDFDGDGKDDLFRWNDGTRSLPSVDVFLSTGTGFSRGVNWDPYQHVGTGGNVLSVVGNFDGE